MIPTIRIYYPTDKSTYHFGKRPIILRTACSAGFNRSAVVREIIKRNIHPESVVYPQYGVFLGNYSNQAVGCVNTNLRDGFFEYFGCDKVPSIQATIFEALGHMPSLHEKVFYLPQYEQERYRDVIHDYYWNFDSTYQNVYVIVNEDKEIIKSLINQLRKTARTNVDLIVINLPDTICQPEESHVIPQSAHAYHNFVKKIKQYFSFEYTLNY